MNTSFRIPIKVCNSRPLVPSDLKNKILEDFKDGSTSKKSEYKIDALKITITVQATSFSDRAVKVYYLVGEGLDNQGFTFSPKTVVRTLKKTMPEAVHTLSARASSYASTMSVVFTHKKSSKPNSVQNDLLESYQRAVLEAVLEFNIKNNTENYRLSPQQQRNQFLLGKEEISNREIRLEQIQNLG